MKIKHIYWFAFFNEQSPSVRYRALYPLAYFKEKQNINYTLVVPGYKPQRIFHFIKTYLGLLFFRKRDSLIVIQRVHTNFIYANLLKFLLIFRNKSSVCDLDDADYLEFPDHNIIYFTKKCTILSAGSTAIALHLKAYNNRIIFTSSPTPDLNIVKKKRAERFTIGWIGSFGGDHKAGMIQQVFPAICSLEFPVKLELLGVHKAADVIWLTQYFASFEHVELSIPQDIDWLDEIGIQHRIAQFDIGIATLLNTEIQLAKSGIKAKQYLNNGVPVLSTPLAENYWVVQDGSNGYFCSNPEEFLQRLIEFNEMDQTTYESFSINARQSSNQFNHEKYLQDFQQIYTQSISSI